VKEGIEMAIYKRGKTWWADFSVNGQRYRQSLDTSDWREAQAKQKESIAQARAFREITTYFARVRTVELTPPGRR
jgi:hypothetical protein